MVKKKHSWGKGYRRRHQEAQRKEAAKQYKRREGPRMAKDYSQEQLAEAYQEAEIVTWQNRAKQYREAWEAEKKVSQAHLEGWRTSQQQLDEAKTRRLATLLLGAFLGLIAGLIIGANLL
jgi:hypothetical protein